MANSVRVAADILKWQASVRNPRSYGEKRQIDAEVTVVESPETIARRVYALLFAERHGLPDPGRVLDHEQQYHNAVATHPVPVIPEVVDLRPRWSP